MASFRYLSLVLLLSIFFYIASARDFELYFDDDSTITVPFSLDKNSCSKSQPCYFGDKRNVWHRYYPGTSIKAIFTGGIYFIKQDVHFGCSGDLTTIFQDSPGFYTEADIYFGNSTHKVDSFKILNSTFTIVGSSIHAFANSNAVIEDSSFTSLICDTCSIAMHLGNNADVLIKDVNYYGNQSAFQIRSDEDLNSLSLIRTSFKGPYNLSVLALRANKVNQVDFLNVKVSVRSAPLLVSHIAGPTNNISVDVLTMRGCHFEGLSSDMNSNFRIFPETAQIEENEFGSSAFLFQPPSVRGKTFSFSYNEVEKNGSISVMRFQKVLMEANLFEYSRNLASHDIDYFESNNDQYYSVGSVNISRADEVWFDSIYSLDSNFNLTSINSSAVTYSLIERQKSRTSTFAIEVSSNIVLYESSWIDDSKPISKAMLTLSTFGTPPSPISVTGSALIMGLAVITQGSEFHNFGVLDIVGSLTGAKNQTWINSGIFAFHSHPNTCEPVTLTNVAILPSSDGDFSVISAVVWSDKDKCGALKIGVGVTLQDYTDDVLKHILEILIIGTNNAAEKVDGSKPVPIIHVESSSFGAQNFTAVYPSSDFDFDPSYAFTGFLRIAARTSHRVYEYHVTNFTCPKNCSNNGNCVGLNSCSCNKNYSGYSCACHDLPKKILCSSDEEDLWMTASDLHIDDSDNLEFPENTGVNINGSLYNNGSLVLNNARYDIADAFTNQGQLQITSTISQVPNATVSGDGGCIFVPTSRSFASNLVLAPGSTITVDLDLASAATSVCPSSSADPSSSKYSTQSPKTRSRSSEMQELLVSKRAVRPKLLGSRRPKSSQARSKAAKSKSLLESDSNSMSGSIMIVNITSVPVEPISIVLVASRNASATTIPLLVEVNAPSGVCTTLENTPNLVAMVASPCTTSAATPSGTISKTRWYYIAAPIIAVSGLVVIAIIVILSVPKIRKAVYPYSG